MQVLGTPSATGYQASEPTDSASWKSARLDQSTFRNERWQFSHLQLDSTSKEGSDDCRLALNEAPPHPHVPNDERETASSLWCLHCLDSTFAGPAWALP